MKRLMAIAISAMGLLAAPAVVRAQDCSNWNNMRLAGTYTMSGGGYIDLSKALAGIQGLPPLPQGLIPMFWTGVTTFDGAGNGGGWVSFNAGGTQLSASFVNKKYSAQPNTCSYQVNYSLKIDGLNVTVGPFSHLMVPVLKPGMGWMAEGLELHLVSVGAAPGAPSGTGPVVDSGVLYRISMQY